MPMPVWAALLGIALAKKVVVFTAAKVYGIPKLYRKSQQLARWSINDKATLKTVSGRIGYVYRVPDNFIARWFGPTAAQLARTLPSGPVPLQQGRSPTTQNILKSSFADRIVTGSAPAYSKSLLARTLQSGQHYFQLRGSSVPRAGLHSALRPLQLSLNSSAAVAALGHLRKPFNFVSGHSFTGQRTFVYT
ncbi:TPA: hypothetical protein ACH3X3_004299 [Trebouxia sp. C0006]